MRLVSLFLLLSAAASAGEYVVFASGSRLHVDRHEVAGEKVRLFIGGGVMELSKSEVAGYEREEHAPPAPSPAAAQVVRPEPGPAELADAAADRYGLPRWLVRSVMSAESGFQPQAVSPKGAIGLMQLMPATAEALGADPRDPAQNVDAGARYLRDLLLKYDNRLWHALAAYNAGPEAVDRYGGVPPYSETIGYVSRIDRDRKKNQAKDESGN